MASTEELEARYQQLKASENLIVKIYMAQVDAVNDWGRQRGQFGTGPLGPPDGLVYAWSLVTLVLALIGAYYGAQFGWNLGGVLGGILFFLIGILVGQLISRLLAGAVLAFGMVAIWGAGIGIIIFAFKIIVGVLSALWGLGK